MKLCMSLVASLLLVAGCKTDKQESSASAPATDPAAHTGRSGKIEMPRRPPGERPALPGDDAAGSAGADLDDADRAARREDRRNARMADLDKDGDGKISDEERQAGRTRRMDMMRQRMDTNNDGKLTVDELEKSRLGERLGDVKAIDADGNGEISSDELQKAMESLRANRGFGGRGGWRNGADPKPAE